MSRGLMTLMLLLLVFLINFLAFADVVLVQGGGCSSSCGEIGSIRYPFRLKGDPSECGDPNYELVCRGNKTLILLGSFSAEYYVTNISYESSQLSVVGAQWASKEEDVSCALSSRSVSEDDIYSRFGNPYVHPFSVWPDPSTFTVVSFVKCSEEIHGHGYIPLPCLNRRNSSINGGFVYVTYAVYEVGDLQVSCSFLSTVPIKISGIAEEESPLSSSDDIFQKLHMGFVITWETKDMSIAQILLECLNSNQVVEAEKSVGASRLSILLLPLKIQRPFLGYLLDNEYQEQRHFVAALILTWLLIILTNIAYLVIVFALVGRLLGLLSIYVFLCHQFWKMRVPIDKIEKFLRLQKTLSPTRYSYSDIVAMTSNFNKKLGQGGCGSVFKGVLPGGPYVAIKTLDNSKCNGDDFISEVSTIGRIHHLNVVRLLGFCSEGSKRALIYEFMPNGSLDKYIGINSHFTNEKLNEIALGVAKGIEYLHQGCDERILHFDIKPANILLDHSFNPKVSDFGLAKLYPKEYSVVSICAARGTIGYIAPELVNRCFGVVSYKADVYSFGMLLMKMAGGRRNFDQRLQNLSQSYYPSWIYDRLEQRELGFEICNDIEIDDMERKLCKIGLWCIQTRPSDRPSMSKVVEWLEGDVDTLPLPPKPFTSSSQPTSIRQSSMDSTYLTELSIISEEND